MTESSGEGGADVTTTYRLDVGGHLSRVFAGTTVSGVVVNKTRHFAYDNLGFLRSETHPEKGATGNGSVTYSNYTARGQVGRKVDGANDLTYSYDRAERLTQVQETGGAGRLLKTFAYAGSNGTGDLRLGKLQTSVRYNYPILGGTTYSALVNQAYVYGGRDGRVSQRTSSLTFNGATNETFTAAFTYTPLGDLATVSYPQCAFAACTSAGATVPRTVSYTYTNGFLTGVPGYASSLTYNSNGLINQVVHANGMTDTETRDPFAMHRPASIAAAGPTGWSSGTYSYDGAGNIKSIGTAAFTYDKVSRLVTSSQFDGTTGGGTRKIQNYTFDPFGNLTTIAGTSGRATPTDPNTNRLNAAGVAYDAMGNLTAWNGATYEYDGFNQMKHMVNGSQEWLYMYDADDERFWSFQVGGSARFDRFTLRDLTGKALRTYEATGYNWTGSVVEDDIFRSGLLLAAETTSGTRHFHLDHLGTPRLITNAIGGYVAYHVYYPFGEEATAFNQDAERMKFTGHERDLASLAGSGDDLDYMHARHCSPLVGRFLTVDTGAAKIKFPQSWNRFAYAMDNPIRYFDSDGREIGDFSTPPSERAHTATLSQGMTLAAAVGGAGYVLVGGGAVAAGVEQATVGATTVGGALTLLGSKVQGAIDFLRNLGAESTGTPTSYARPLTAADLGLAGDINELKGSFSLAEGHATVRVEMIRATVKNPLQIIDNLIKLAERSGADTLRIEGTLAEPRLYSVLARRYGLVSDGSTDSFLILLRK